MYEHLLNKHLDMLQRATAFKHPVKHLSTLQCLLPLFRIQGGEFRKKGCEKENQQRKLVLTPHFYACQKEEIPD